MSVIVRLQNLPWAANAVDIRQFFHGLSIPEGGVHIVGGELGDAFIAFSTDEDARQAMLRDGGKVKDISIKLYLSSRAEMQKIIDQARQQSLGMQQFMSMPTMTPIAVPVTNITVPNIPVPSVSIPNVQNVQGMQVPLQNVAAMVTNLGKHDPASIARPAPTGTGIQDLPDNKSVVSSNVSVKSDSEKDKKDKRRRRTRSHSRESSNSRTDSRSRSRSRSSSRSRDRKGRDRHYDRRRKRSRSRDRRRRRDRSRSRERSHRDRRKDYNRHGSREEFDDNNQSSRWNNPAQRNRQNKPRSEFYNRDQLNQNRTNYQQKPNLSKGPSNEPMRSSFPNNNSNQSNNDMKGPILHPKDDNNLHPSLPVVSSGSGPGLPTSSSLPQNSQTVSISQNMGSNSQNPGPSQNPNNQNYYGDLPPPPMFNPQHLVSYPNYNPNSMPQFNMFPPMSPHQLKPANVQQDMSKKQEMDSIADFGGEPRNSPLIHSSGSELKTNHSNKFETDLKPHERGNKSRFGNEHIAKEIPLPNNDKIQGGGGASNWGFKDSNYPYGNKEQKPGPDKRESFNSGWGNVTNSNNNSNIKSNTFSKKITNTCVQIKNVPDHTKHDDIREFFRNNHIDSGCLKIVGDEQGTVNGVFVKFNSVGDKKKAICRSGCLLNNSIVTVLHADDKDFNNATDVVNEHHPYWIPGEEEMEKNNVGGDSKMVLNKNINNPLCCIKFQGDMRYHPLFNATHKVHPHISTLCDKFNPIDVCVVQSIGRNCLDALMKFENKSCAEAALKSLSHAKIDGKSIVVTICSIEEFLDAKANCIAMDVQQFLRNAKGQLSNLDKSNVKQDDRVDPRLQSSSYSDRRTKHDDHDEDDSLENDIEMKTSDDEPEPEFKRSNKVLLPTPSPMLQLPLLKDNSIPNCILMQNLPLQANEHEITHFFSDIGVVPVQIHIMLDSNGKQYGDAYCEFDKSEDAANASSKDGFSMGKNNVHVCLVSKQEMSNALGLFVSTSGPNNMGGPPQVGPYFNGPPGPPLFGNNMRMGGNDWMPPGPMFNPGGGPMGSNPNFNNMNTQGERGFRQGSRGGYRGRGDGDFGGRGNRGSRGGGDRGGRGRGDFGNRGGDFNNRGGDFNNRGGDFNNRGDFGNRGGDFGNRGGDFNNRGDCGNRGGDFGNRGGDFGNRGGRGGESGGRGRGSEGGGRGGRGSEVGSRGGRGSEGGGRGGRGSEGGGRGGRGNESSGRGLGRGSMRNNDIGGRGGGRGGGMDGRGGRGGGDGGRGRGGRGNMRGGMTRGGRDEFPRNQPPDLMSLPSAPPIENPGGGPPSLLQPSSSVTRPIQLEEDSVREFGHTGCVVSAENVPYRAELNDILEFFGDFDLTAESIIRRYNDVGQVTGDARIAFKTPADAKRAIKYLNKKMIGNRKVNLTLFK